MQEQFSAPKKMNPPTGAGTGYCRRRRQTHLLGQFEDFDRAHAVVDRVALGLVHRTIKQSILTIWGALDEFMLTDTARRTLGAETKSGSRP